MTSTTSPAPGTAPGPALDSLFGRVWPDPTAAGRPRLVAASLAVGAFAAVVLPWRAPGVGALLVLLAVVAVPAAVRARSVTRLDVAFGVLCAGLLSIVVLRDAAWIVALCLLAAFLLGSVALARGRSIPGMVAAAVAVPLASLRGLPWLARSLATTRGPAAAWPVVRTAALSVVLLLAFGALFASADAVFAAWAGAFVPDLSLDGLVLRAFVLAAVGGFTLCSVYVAVVPPHVDFLTPAVGSPVRRFEWAVPVGLVSAVFVVFLAAQLTALFGGHEHLRRTTGLTYAEYVHQGFWQLTFATALTLVVVAVASRKAPRATSRDRMWLRGLLGLLCVLTLVVVGSALYRMHVYEEAYGFTRLRVLVSVFEAWLGVVVLLVLGAGARLRGAWVPVAALLSGSAMLLGLALANPDGYIAERNIERFARTGEVDRHYLAGLSADAVPALTSLPQEYADCVLADREPSDDDWLEWNLGRARAGEILMDRRPAPIGSCDSLRSW